jgi:hypothetical protein
MKKIIPGKIILNSILCFREYVLPAKRDKNVISAGRGVSNNCADKSESVERAGVLAFTGTVYPNLEKQEVPVTPVSETPPQLQSFNRHLRRYCHFAAKHEW